MRIGNLEIDSPVRLAPMAGITNASFRLVAKECGSALITSEEIDATGLGRHSDTSEQIAEFLPEEHPLAMQLLGKDIDSFVKAAEILQQRGADIIDINMGCPVPKITKTGKGSALMQDVAKTALILRALRRACQVPLTIKIRGGWDNEHLNAVEVAQMAESEGVDAITVHPRTRSQRFSGRAPWHIIRDVVEAVNIPITGNGDVTSYSEAQRMMAETGCVSVMIGRGAMGQPWVFNPEYEGWPEERQREYREKVIMRHMDLILSFFPEGRYRLLQIQRHLSYYARGMPSARECRQVLFTQCSTPEESLTTFRRYWDAAPVPAAG
ncbi:MAG: tRNA dihydrouridine synthase DusB [Chloroflexi bacterium]|nr:tRNA dihydrouridine synthase DusB [Chloroflexota bacterium]